MILNIDAKVENPIGHIPNNNQKLTAEEVNEIVSKINSLQVLDVDDILEGAFSIIDNKTTLSIGINYNKLAAKLSTLTYICPTISSVIATKTGVGSASILFVTDDENGLFRYSIDNGSLININSNPFTINGLTSDSHIITVNSINNTNNICASKNTVIDLSEAPIVYHFYVGWTATNPFINNSTIPTFTQQSVGNVINGNINADFHLMPSQYYPIIRVDADVPIKTTWYDTPFNNGTIPDSVWRDSFLIGNNRYYIGRNPTDFDTTPNHKILIS